MNKKTKKIISIENIRWPVFVPLALIILVAIFLANFIPGKTTLKKQATTLPAVSFSQPSPQAVFELAILEQTTSHIVLDVALTSSLEDVSGFSLRLINQHPGQTTISINPQLERAGWFFPIQKTEGQQIDLSGIYPKLENYSFAKGRSVATITIKTNVFEQNNFQIDHQASKVISKSNQILTPSLQWTKN